MFDPRPTVVSPRYEKCGTFDPSPIFVFFISANVPTCAPLPITVPGRSDANGPTSAPSPTFADRRTANGPIEQPDPIFVSPCRTTLGCRTVSGPTDTPTST